MRVRKVRAGTNSQQSCSVRHCRMQNYGALNCSGWKRKEKEKKARRAAVIHYLRSAASFLFSSLFPLDYFASPPFLPSSGGVVRFVLRYWRTNMFRRGSQSQRKSEGEEKGRKKEKKRENVASRFLSMLWFRYP